MSRQNMPFWLKYMPQGTSIDDVSHFLSIFDLPIRLCNKGSLRPLGKFIEHCKIVALLPVIPLGIRNNW